MAAIDGGSTPMPSIPVCSGHSGRWEARQICLELVLPSKLRPIVSISREDTTIIAAPDAGTWSFQCYQLQRCSAPGVRFLCWWPTTCCTIVSFFFLIFFFISYSFIQFLCFLSFITCALVTNLLSHVGFVALHNLSTDSFSFSYSSFWRSSSFICRFWGGASYLDVGVLFSDSNIMWLLWQFRFCLFF